MKAFTIAMSLALLSAPVAKLYAQSAADQAAAQGLFDEGVAVVTSTNEFVMYLLDRNDCGGEEVACAVSMASGPSFSTFLPIPEGSPSTIVVSSQDPFESDPFELRVNCGLVCAAQ